MLRAHEITVSTDAEPLLERVDLHLGARERVGLVGPNGSGKTTLLRILVGDLRPAAGAVVLQPGIRIGWQRQRPPEPRLTVGEVLSAATRTLTISYAALTRAQRALTDAPTGVVDGVLGQLADAEDRFAAAGGWAALARHDEVRSRLGVAGIDRGLDGGIERGIDGGMDRGIEPTRPLGTLSGGERARVMMAALLLGEPDVLLLDEPTNHLDLDGRRWLADHLQGFHGSVLVASHDRAFLDRVVTRIVEVDDLTSTVADYPGGGWTAYRQEKARRLERLDLDLAAQHKYLTRLTDRIAASKARSAEAEAANPRNPHARRTARMVARKALTHERRLQRLVDSARWVQPPAHRNPLLLKAVDDVGPAAAVRLRGHRVTVGERTLWRQGSLAFGTHDRIWVTGRNGVGKTALLRSLQPLVPGITVLAQADREVTGATRHTALDVLRAAVPMYAADAESLLAAYGFEQRDWTREVRRLSVGQWRRLRLAITLNTPATLLALDEPTNHLDVDTVELLEQVLAAHRGGLLVVSHDERFVDAIGLTTRWVVSREGVQSSPR